MDRTPNSTEPDLAELFRRGYQRLRAAARTELGSGLRRHVDPDDVVQEAFVTAIQLLDRVDFEESAALHAWMRRIAGNKVRDAVHRFDRRKRSPGKGRGEEDPEGVAEETSRRGRHDARDPAGSSGERELMRTTYACLRELSSNHRDVILLRDVFRVPWSTVASILERPTVGAAQQLHARARRELGRRLDPPDGPV